MSLVRIEQTGGMPPAWINPALVAMVGSAFEQVAPKIAGAPPIARPLPGVVLVVIAGVGPQVLQTSTEVVLRACNSAEASGTIPRGAEV